MKAKGQGNHPDKYESGQMWDSEKEERKDKRHFQEKNDRIW